MDFNEIHETVKAASEYLNHLRNLDTELNYAEQQIITSTNETKLNIVRVFDNLIDTITAALHSRKETLIAETNNIKEKGMCPLLQCRQVIHKKMHNTVKLIDLGQDLLDAKHNGNSYLADFIDRSSLLGSLPEVPPLKQVPCLSFQYELNCEEELLNICNNYGSMIHIAPVQVLSLMEKPGAILVEWSAIDIDHILDIQQYRLQKAFGNLRTEKHLQDNFRDCYIGPDTQQLVKDLIINQHYTFRVCCKFGREANWSPWSIPEVGITTIKPFSWNKNENFLLSNENKIASLLSDSPSILFSDGSKFDVGYSVEFTFLECDNNLSDTFVGLFTSEDIQTEKLTNVESVYVEANGNIYRSGVKKSTRLPPVNKGDKICFTCDLRDQNKIRINIDCSGKRVTYDWVIDIKRLYFGAQFNSSKWKIMID